LVDISPVKIDFSVPEKYAQSVKIGDEILFSVEGQPNTYKATVFALEPNIDVATRSMQVRARYANTKESVKPGSFVKVEVPLKNIESAIMVPTEAIVPEAAGHMLYLAKAGKAVPQPVKIGIRSETLIQITEGVQAGDTIIRSGILQVRPGADLDVKEVK
jgi:membrane fusion protein (multidrug efflux system)